jgi:curved DNA-binding protein CbpA
MEQKDYYRILGIDRKAAPREIKEVYRRLAFQYHPDKNRGNAAAVEKMKEINEAYAVLSDPKKKADYDAMGQEFGPFAYDRFRQSHSQEDIFRGSDINQIFEEMARSFGVRGFDEVFQESYGQSYRTFEFRRPGVWGRGFIFSGPIHRGGHRGAYRGEIPTPFGIPSTYLGKMFGFLLKKALGIEAGEKGRDRHDVIALDPRQAREGGKLNYFHRWRSKDLVITIPPGIHEGQSIRLKGMGDDGKGGREPGDLYLKIKLRKPLLQKIREVVGI